MFKHGGPKQKLVSSKESLDVLSVSGHGLVPLYLCERVTELMRLMFTRELMAFRESCVAEVTSSSKECINAG